jgi:hypothetical protein
VKEDTVHAHATSRSVYSLTHTDAHVTVNTGLVIGFADYVTNPFEMVDVGQERATIDPEPAGARGCRCRRERRVRRWRAWWRSGPRHRRKWWGRRRWCWTPRLIHAEHDASHVLVVVIMRWSCVHGATHAIESILSNGDLDRTRRHLAACTERALHGTCARMVTSWYKDRKVTVTDSSACKCDRQPCVRERRGRRNLHIGRQRRRRWR